VVCPAEADRLVGRAVHSRIASAVGASPEVDTETDIAIALPDMENRIVKVGNSSLLVVEAERAGGPVVPEPRLDSEFLNNKG
jgi:hypothetical protein